MLLAEDNTTTRKIEWDELTEAQKLSYYEKAKGMLTEGAGRSLESVAKELYSKNKLDLLQG